MAIYDYIPKWNEVLKKEQFKGFPKEGITFFESNDFLKIAVFDTETTGLNVDPDKYNENNQYRSEVIELAYRVIHVDKDTFKVAYIGEERDFLQEPKEKLSQKIIELTSLTDDQLKGQKIDWKKVQSEFDECDFCLAHNINFDKNAVFFNLKLPKTLCSLYDYKWRENGFYNSTQEVLGLELGFWYRAHRAISDVDALIKILDGFEVLQVIIKNADKKVIRVYGWGGYKFKDYLKLEKEFRFKKENGKSFWEKEVFKEEVKLLQKEINDKFLELRESDDKEVGISILDRE